MLEHIGIWKHKKYLAQPLRASGDGLAGAAPGTPVAIEEVVRKS
ncbi:hypothetical protein P3W85_28910 [Cupriavidus basilensis]|uniref:Uncharacterized protein n=1 Tax=Cupriavidus basilensis TaxID=68895 RepID=A0ABT6AWE2_9BURK|nr:hypothetical protein [Cupriavidus basilensis]MDF3836942.1 hypothetical protein [Cupriavidus basilensis]